MKTVECVPTRALVIMNNINHTSCQARQGDQHLGYKLKGKSCQSAEVLLPIVFGDIFRIQHYRRLRSKVMMETSLT